MVKKNVLELWSIFKERLSPTDMKTLTSLLIDSSRRRIEKTQLIASALLLFKNDEFLHRCFTDFLRGKNSQEDEDGETQKSDEEGEIRERDSKTEVCVRNKESTTPTKERERNVEEAMVYEKDQEDEDGETQSEEEEGEIRERDPKTEVCVRNKEEATTTKESKRDVEGEAMVYDKVQEDEKIKVCDEREMEKYATNVFRLEGNRRRILKLEPPMKTRASKLLERVTPSYELIPEEEQFPVSNNVLNNKYSVMQFNSGSGHKKLSKYEKAMERCEDEMFETDVLMETLKSAVESAEKVIKEEMGVEKLGAQFYRCIERLYGGDMFEIVRKDHMRALPVILSRLKQKLDELIVFRERCEIIWKQALKDNTAKQREATAQGLRKK